MTSHVDRQATHRHLPLRLASVFALALAALLPAATTVLQSAPRPEFVIEHVSVHGLGSLAGGDGIASDINNQGEAVGWSETATGLKHAVLYRAGGVVDIGAWHPAWASEARQINDGGLVVGHSTFLRGDFPEWRAFAWIGGWLVDLDPTILAADVDCQRQTEARAVGDDGTIVGTAWDRAAGPTCVAEQRAVRWSGPTASPLAVGSPARSTQPNDLLSDGTVVGHQLRDVASGLLWHAVRFRAGIWSPVPLPAPAEGSRNHHSGATSINARGDIVGWYESRRGPEQRTKAFLWPAGAPAAHALDLASSPWMKAADINDDRFVVGSADVTLGGVDRRVAYVYHPSIGMRILPVLPPLFGQHCSANALNERNPATGVFQVVGTCGTARLHPVRWEVRAVRPAPSTTP